MPKRERSPGQEDVLKHPSTKVAKRIDQNAPMAQLDELLKSHKHADQKPRNVLHWFRSKDIRMQDNKALAAASSKAREGSGALLTCYLFSPKDMQWHGTSPARSDFILESLRALQKELEAKNIPLTILTAEERGNKVDKVLEFVKTHDVSHVFANFEYEVDELRRDVHFVKHADEAGLGVELFHDQTVVTPGQLSTGSGTPHKVFTPYHKTWLAEISSHPDLLNLSPDPVDNDKAAAAKLKDLFGSAIPTLPSDKQFASKDEQGRIRKLWPAGHAKGIDRLNHFLKHKAKNYAATRSEPAQDSTSRLSAYFASGVVSVREALQAAKKQNGSANFSGSGGAGIAAWVRELVFREFYRHTLVGLPHGAMNLPQNLKFDSVEWEDDEEGWRKWCDGTTGVPFVDAGMRQLNHEGYMHNRLRMNTSSYLSGNLLIDYRRGERYFAEHLVDWDLANNTNGWEPSHTVFNPVAQAEKCDPDGEYIRKWVPELRGVAGKAVFAPAARLGAAEFDKLKYPRPHVDFESTKARATERYKAGFRRAEAAE